MMLDDEVWPAASFPVHPKGNGKGLDHGSVQVGPGLPLCPGTTFLYGALFVHRGNIVNWISTVCNGISSENI